MKLVTRKKLTPGFAASFVSPSPLCVRTAARGVRRALVKRVNDATKADCFGRAVLVACLVANDGKPVFAVSHLLAAKIK